MKINQRKVSACFICLIKHTHEQLNVNDIARDVLNLLYLIYISFSTDFYIIVLIHVSLLSCFVNSQLTTV